MKLLTAEEARQITLKYIQVSDRKERANRIERTRKIIDYLYHRQLRLFLKKRRKNMSLPYAPPCIDGKGIRQSHISEGVIVSPDGRPISHMCRSCAQRVIDGYREKLGVVWTFEEREYEQINPNRPLYVYDSPSVAASTLGRLGGLSKSEAKAISSRENGKKGGRPRKIREEGNIETIEESNFDLFT